MKFHLKAERVIDNVTFSKGDHEVPDSFGKHWYILALEQNGDLVITEKPSDSAANEGLNADQVKKRDDMNKQVAPALPGGLKSEEGQNVPVITKDAETGEEIVIPPSDATKDKDESEEAKLKAQDQDLKDHKDMKLEHQTNKQLSDMLIGQGHDAAALKGRSKADLIKLIEEQKASKKG